MKLYVSADIEGTTGITLWDETINGHPRYSYFATQMTREVSAACCGALKGGFDDILIKDAHDTACNLLPAELPEDVRLFRGWGSDPHSMMAGLNEAFDGVMFTGYHSGAGMNTNPLAHTMNTRNMFVRINDTICPELMINALTAAMYRVPVLLVTGDKGLCEWINDINPNIETVAVSEGCGRGSISIHPNKAVRLIEEAAERACRKASEECMFPMPEHFKVEIGFKEHFKAKNAASYPGVKQTGVYTIEFDSDDYETVLRTLDWVM